MLTEFDEEPERWIDVRWDLDEAGTKRFHSRISLNAINEPGTLAEVAQTVAASDSNIRTLSMVRVADDFQDQLEVIHRQHLRTLDPLYFEHAQRRLDGLRKWTQGRVQKRRPGDE